MLRFVRLKRGYRSTRFARGQTRPFVLARLHRSMSASIFIPPAIKRLNEASLQPYFGEELSVLTLRKKHLFLKRQVKRIQERFACSKIFSGAFRCGAERPHCGVF